MMHVQKTLYVITVNADNYRNNLFYDEVRRGINIEANLTDINVEFLFGFGHPIEKFSEAIGVIFAPDGSKRCKDFIDTLKKRYHIPIIQIDNQVSDRSLAPEHDAFIGTDNYHGGELTARYLGSFLPRRSRVLVIAGNRDFAFLSYNDRLKGFQDSGYFEIAKIVYGEFNHAKIYHEVADFFSKTATPPDAIMAFNDDSAVIARKALKNFQLHKKVLITGFDGSAAGRAALSKKQILCSYDQNPEDLGRQAFHLLCDVSENREVSPTTLLKGTLLTEKNIGITFYPGVENFLDRALIPSNFRKRRYELVTTDVLREKPLVEFRNELICPIFFGKKDDVCKVLRHIDADKFIIVSDNNIFLEKERKSMAQTLREEGLQVDEASFPFGEKNKTPEVLLGLVENILEKKISKTSCLILLGGGVTGNVGGFAASILYRGIRFVHIPTTVMHMVDSSTGGKQAVDTRFGKNSLGNFSEPECIFIDERLLETLPERELQSGLAECIKHALCQDSDLYDFIIKNVELLLKKKDIIAWHHVIGHTIALKTEIMNNDSYELNEGMILVYGHTLGNAVESASGYVFTHGEGVGIGMVAAAKIACRLGLATENLVTEHINILEAAGLPTKIPTNIPLSDILDFLLYDKKHTVKPLSFVLLSAVGKVYMHEGVVPVAVDKNIVEEVLQSLYE